MDYFFLFRKTIQRNCCCFSTTTTTSTLYTICARATGSMQRNRNTKKRLKKNKEGKTIQRNVLCCVCVFHIPFLFPVKWPCVGPGARKQTGRVTVHHIYTHTSHTMIGYIQGTSIYTSVQTCKPTVLLCLFRFTGSDRGLPISSLTLMYTHTYIGIIYIPPLLVSQCTQRKEQKEYAMMAHSFSVSLFRIICTSNNNDRM